MCNDKTKSVVNEIVNEIVSDIRDRRGLKHEWNMIDEEIQEEIKKDWASIIERKLKENKK